LRYFIFFLHNDNFEFGKGYQNRREGWLPGIAKMFVIQCVDLGYSFKSWLDSSVSNWISSNEVTYRLQARHCTRGLNNRSALSRLFMAFINGQTYLFTYLSFTALLHCKSS